MDYCEEMKEAVREALERTFGEIDDSGCYKHNGQWFSLESVYQLICDTLDGNKFMFVED